MKLVLSQSLEKLPQAEEPQLFCPRSLSGFHALCPFPTDWMKDGVEVGPLQLAGKLEGLPLFDLEFGGQEER